MEEYIKEYLRWTEKACDEMKNELRIYDEKQIEDAFYCSLAFGTGGLRGVLGAGTNRMNVHTVGKATQGLANYLKEKYGNKASVVIGFDTRKKSETFAQTTASVFNANGIKVYIWNKPLPVPTVSYAIRYLKACAGVMITASHNPAKYNGYKVYGSDGCQITTEIASTILNYINKIDIFDDVKISQPNENRHSMGVEIGEEVFSSYISEIKKQSFLYGDKVSKDVSIVYSPLNGTGAGVVPYILHEEGYENITIVAEQEKPDGNFPTCPYPNPENAEALSLGLEYCRRLDADLMLATDPDCDRVGIAVKDSDGEYVLLTGNETGILLLDYICSQRIKHGKMPHTPILIKTIVTSDMAEKIAKSYGLETINVLTGFKYIGEQIGILEAEDELERYIFGFEESYGYLSGGYVRDKDAVNGACLICEMLSHYKTQGITLYNKLSELYAKYGYYLNSLYCFEFEGCEGQKKMQGIMEKIRENVVVGKEWVSKQIEKVFDYNQGLDKLPKSNVIKCVFEDNCSMVIRPSGTEPKLKIYISVLAKSKGDAIVMEQKLVCAVREFLGFQ